MNENNKLIEINVGAIREAKWVAERDELIDLIVKIETIESDSESQNAGLLQTRASKLLKVLEGYRKKVKAPVTKAGKDIEAQAKELGLELTKAIARIRTENSRYLTKENERKEAERSKILEAEALRAAEEAAQEPETISFGGQVVELDNEPETRTEPAPVLLPEKRANVSSIVQVEVWEFEVEDSRKVPDAYKTIDDKKIRAYMKYQKTLGEVPQIQGVRFTKRIDTHSK